MKQRIIRTSSLFILLVLVITCGIITFGWFALSDTVPSFRFELAKVNSEIWYYYGHDSSSNGLPNIMDDETKNSRLNDEMKYPKSYYQEIRDFEYIDKKEAKAENVETIDLVTNLDKFVPTKITTYKISLKNKSDSTNAISIKFDDVTLEGSLGLLMSTLAVRTGEIVKNADDTYYVDYTKGNIIYFCDFITKNSNSYTFTNDLTNKTSYGLKDYLLKGRDSGVSDEDFINNCVKDFWLQFEMVSYEELLEHENFKNFNVSIDDYNSLQSLSGLKLNFSILFEVDTDIIGKK